MSKISSTLFVIVLFVGGIPFVSEAQTTGSSLQAQLELLTKLQAQISQLQGQLQTVQTQRAQIVSELVSTLRQGSQGNQVSALQALLAADPDIYPEGLLTGFFGPATERAVKRFQAKQGLPSVGIVGPLTRGKLNATLKNTPISFEFAPIAGGGSVTSSVTSSTPGHRPCAIVPPGHLIAPGWLRKQGGVAPIVPACQILPPGIAMKLGLSTSTPPTPTSTPDIVPPILSIIAATSTTSAATVTWVTNEISTSKAYYGTVSPINLVSTSTLVVANSSLVINHSLNLVGLSASSTYYFVVESADISGNIATSAQQSFITAP
ncbi:MAG: hypothetical protein A3B25_01145 [Candidatus Ryanbacteria bacterium RIFCSPLOWO2_01_FULL_48_26]|uniref:Peptidoglycan binding-like domain-containing protein n=1 Tax=Candidatus Ryanbacteria bacterium RIFCSPLOWO2_01_FULL_48_26 TaxID=1802126 RepID=A0A1G2GRJ3_9BACT|nr:MAG: hypothetical protein A3B25_01145 [Candidatus Ryanbacteria bacterium RIFCSPLOWO2_01_FULL_48_26]